MQAKRWIAVVTMETEMSDLRKAAQEALEALEYIAKDSFEPFGIPLPGEIDITMDALRAALAQPEQEPYTSDVPRIMREAGMTFHLGLPHKAVIEQMTRVVDLVCAEASIKAAQQFAAALAQPEQEPVAWRYALDASVEAPRWIYITQDPHKWRQEPGMVNALIEPLYTAPPQRKPLTDDEIELAYREIWRDLSDGFSHTSVEWIEAGIRYAEKVHGIE